MFRDICYRMAWFFTVVWGASWLGAVHDVGDSLATFRPIWLAAALICAGLAWPIRRRGAAIVAMLGTVGFGVTAMTWGVGLPGLQVHAQGAPSFRLYQNNLFFAQSDHSLTLANIAALSPDVITFQEVSQNKRSLLEELRADYPHQAFCRYGAVGAVMVLSRLPATDTKPLCLYPMGLVALQVVTPGGPVWVVSVHAKWPYPFNDPAQVDYMETALAKLEGEIVMAGDFNMVAGTHRLRRLARAAGVTRMGPWVPTFRLPSGPEWWRYPIQIDHVFTTMDAKVRRAPDSGSDHVPLVADLW